MNLVPQLVLGLWIKSKAVMSSRSEKKDSIFCNIYFVQKKFFNICVLSQVYSIEYTVRICILLHITYQKTLLVACFYNRGKPEVYS